MHIPNTFSTQLPCSNTNVDPYCCVRCVFGQLPSLCSRATFDRSCFELHSTQQYRPGVFVCHTSCMSHSWSPSSTGALENSPHKYVPLRGTMVNRTYGTDKNLYIYHFLLQYQYLVLFTMVPRNTCNVSH